MISFQKNYTICIHEQIKFIIINFNGLNVRIKIKKLVLRISSNFRIITKTSNYKT